MHGPWIQYPLLLALYRYIATWRLSQIQEEKVQSDCCLEFSWHSRPSGPYSERFREASPQPPLVPWLEFHGLFLWFLDSLEIQKHHETSCSTLKGQRKTTWKTMKNTYHKGLGLWYGDTVTPNLETCWFVLRNTSSIPATCSNRVSRWPHQASWISDP